MEERPRSYSQWMWAFAFLLVLALTGAGFQYWSLDGVSGLFLTVLLRDDTEYAPAYTDRAFRRVEVGMSEQTVHDLLGSPLVETWEYTNVRDPGCFMVSFEGNLVAGAYSRECGDLGIRDGMRRVEAVARLKPPDKITWHFSRSPRGSHYRERAMTFVNNRVVERFSQWYVD